MADEPMVVDQIGNSDTVKESQVNGVESSEEQEVSGVGTDVDIAAPSSEANDIEAAPESPMKLAVEEDKGDEMNSSQETIEQSENGGRKEQENIPETPLSNSAKGRKRKASESSTEEEELKGFDPPPEPSPLTKYRIDKIEKDIREAELEAQKLRSGRPPAKRLHLASPAHLSDASSRPSSGLSVRSESELMGSDHINSAASSPQPAKGRKSNVNLSNPLYRVPMEHGWKRELVYRATLDQYQRRQGDIYYYTPQGKKLRSTREVSEYLTGTGLTLDHFTFFKEPLGLDDPDKEIIRDAIQRTRTDSPVFVTQEKATPSPLVREGKRTPKPKGPKGASPERGVTPKLAAPFKVKSLGSRLSSQSQATPSPAKGVKDQPKGKIVTKQIKKNDEGKLTTTTFYESDRSPTMEKQQVYSVMRMPVSMLKYGTQPGEMSPKSGRELCSIHCPSARGQIPSLQCSVCLCLYHNACEGISEEVQHFMCKSCQAAHHKVIPGPPPLTPLSSLKAVQKPTPAVLPPPPQLQRLVKDAPPKIPQPLLVPVIKTVPVPKILKTVSKLVPVPKLIPQDTVGKQIPPKKKSIVGSVTTWLPPSSSIRLAPKPTAKLASVSPTIPFDILQGRFPQTIAIVNGKKYIIVPKHNVLNVPQLSNNTGPVVAKQVEGAPKIGNNNTNQNTSSVSNKDTLDTIASNTVNDSSTNVESNETVEGGSIKTESTEQDSVKEENMELDLESVPTDDKVEEPETAAEKKRGKTPVKVATPKQQKSPKSATKPENGAPAGRRGRKTAAEKKEDKPNQEASLRALMECGMFVQIFGYLNKRELAAAARVCRGWRDIAYTPTLWKTVRMKNSQVTDWQGLASALKRQKTRHLDLRKMLLPPDDTDNIWDQFTKHIATVDSLLRIELCRCPSSVLERICKALPQLQTLTATSLKCSTLNPEPLSNMTHLTELRIKGMNGLSLTSDLRCLEKLTKLKHLSLTSVRELEKLHCEAIGKLTMLECLELGDCTFTGEQGATLLSPLQRLTRLRLEKSPADSSAVVLNAAAKLPHLTHLELINFEIKSGFEEALSSCVHVKRLLIIPMYVSQSATTNKCVLEGVLNLRKTLTHLVWGVTIELLRVTELFIDQCERPADGAARSPKPAKKPPMGDSIPVLKPVPGLTSSASDAGSSGGEDTGRGGGQAGPAQVEILPLPTLQRLLNTELPDTRLKILRIPFHATWRQALSDLD